MRPWSRPRTSCSTGRRPSTVSTTAPAPCGSSCTATTGTSPPRTSWPGRPRRCSPLRLAHRELAISRPQGTATVRVSTPDAEDDSSLPPHSVVEVVCDDMPFLVDSVTAELSRHGRAIHLVIHPQLVVRRDVAGQLLEVCNASTAQGGGEGAVVESWMHIEIDREPDEAERRRSSTADLDRVLRDVREAVEDWPKMRTPGRAGRRRDRGGAAGGGLPDAGGRRRPPSCCAGWPTTTSPSSATASTCCGPGTTAGTDRLVAVPGSGLGILRADQPQDRRLRTAAARRQRALARKRQLLRRHQGQQPLDGAPTGLPRLRRRQVVRRGRATSWGSAGSSGCSPRPPTTRASSASRCCAARPREVLARSGFSSQQPLRQGPAADPGDLPARRAVPDLGRRPGSRPRSRCCTCRSAASCGCSCAATTTAGSCPAWSTCRATATPPRSGRRWRRSCSTPSTAPASTTPPWSPSRCSPGCTSSCASTPSNAVPDVDPADVEARARARDPHPGTTTSSTLCATAAASRQAVRLADVYADAFPEALQGGPARRRRGRRPAPAGGAAPTTATSTSSSTRRRGAADGERRLKLFHVGEPVSLSQVLPRLQEMGVEVVDERPYHVERNGLPAAWVYDFGLRYEPSASRPETTPGSCSRTRSPRSGPARPRATASTRWCCGPG